MNKQQVIQRAKDAWKWLWEQSDITYSQEDMEDMWKCFLKGFQLASEQTPWSDEDVLDIMEKVNIKRGIMIDSEVVEMLQQYKETHNK